MAYFLNGHYLSYFALRIFYFFFFFKIYQFCSIFHVRGFPQLFGSGMSSLMRTEQFREEALNGQLGAECQEGLGQVCSPVA